MKRRKMKTQTFAGAPNELFVGRTGKKEDEERVLCLIFVCACEDRYIILYEKEMLGRGGGRARSIQQCNILIYIYHKWKKKRFPKAGIWK